MSKKKTKQPDPDITYQGTAITLPGHPKKMPIDEAIDVLKRKKADEETITDVQEQIIGHPMDALVAFNKAMKEIYGWASPQPTPGFFGPTPPDLITIKTGPKEADKVQVPHGQFKLPNIENPIQSHLVFHTNPHMLVITGQVRKKEQEILTELAAKTREILKAESIYKGRAIRLPVDEDGDVNFNSITFFDTDEIKPDELILNRIEEQQLEASLWTPIKNTEACVKHSIPLNRGILLEGPFGTGKTMSAHITSKVCTENGWTYIMLDNVMGLKEALLFAQRYEPCVVFAEDIDRVIEERDERGNDLLNTIDGVLTKHSKVITVMTTNHVEKLDRAMLRPGRLDAIISVAPPDAEAATRLVRLYARDLLDQNTDLTEAVNVMAGSIPATIREVVERSKLGMIAAGRNTITGDDLVVSAFGMQRHLELLNSDKPDQSDGDKLAEALRSVIDGDEAAERIENAAGRATNRLADTAKMMARSVEKNTRVQAAVGEAVTDKLDEVKDDTTAIRRAL